MPILWKDNKAFADYSNVRETCRWKGQTKKDNGERSRYAWTARYIHLSRFPASTFERGCNIVHVFRMGTCRGFFRLLSDALITKNVLMQYG